MSDERTLDQLTKEWFSRGLGRRQLLRLLAAGAGTSAIAAVLAACGGATATPTSAPAGGAATATRAPAATAATGAGAAATSPPVASPAIPAAVGTPGPGASRPVGGQVSYHWRKPNTFQPLHTTSGSEQGVQRLLFGALVKINDKLEAVPDIAAKIDVSPDAKVYTFHMQQGLNFTDGQPLTAKDVVFTIERAVDKRTGSYWRGRLLGIAGATAYGDQQAEKISGLEAPDDYTIKMTLDPPDSTWLLTIGDFAGLGIIPMHVFKDVAPDQIRGHPFSLNPNVTAGVFKFVKYETDQFLEIQRNENYGGKNKAQLDRIFARIIPQVDVAIAQIERGELDLMIVPVSEVDRVRRNANLTVVSVPSPSFDFLTLDLERPYFQDKRLRQALHWAIDREAIVKEIYKGEAEVVQQSIIGPEWMFPLQLTEYKYDPDRARQLIRESGWDTNRRVEAIMSSPPGKEREAYAPILQQQFKDIGFQMELRVVEGAEYLRKLVQQHDYEIAFVGGGIFRQDPNVSAKYFETANWTPAGGNYEHYSNPKVDELFKQGRATSDREQRKRIYTEVAQILNDEVPWVFLWSPNSIFAHSKRLVGFKAPSYSTHEVWNAEEWSVSG